jgi:uncharacterized protein YoxC
MYGFDMDGILAILGKIVVANNRLLLDIQEKDKTIETLKDMLEKRAQAEVEAKDSSNG